MTARLSLLAALLAGAAGAGCSSMGSGEVIHVTRQDRAQQQHALEEKTISWLEKMPQEARLSAMNRAPKIRQLLRDATKTDLKPRADALNLNP